MTSSDAESISCAALMLNGATHNQLVNGYGQMNSAGYCINEIYIRPSAFTYIHTPTFRNVTNYYL